MKTYIILINFIDYLIQMDIAQTEVLASLLKLISGDITTAIFVKIGEGRD